MRLYSSYGLLGDSVKQFIYNLNRVLIIIVHEIYSFRLLVYIHGAFPLVLPLNPLAPLAVPLAPLCSPFHLLGTLQL